MRLELIFEIEKPEIPKDNKSIWISFLKNSLTQACKGKFYDTYFAGTKMKDYTFSVLLPSPKFVGEKIILDHNQVKLLFSADDKNKTGLIFFQAFIAAKQKRFPLPEGNAITLKRINQMREKLITSSKVMFRTVTGGGLVVRDHNRETNRDKFLTFYDEGFAEQLKQVLKMQAKEAGFAEKWGEEISFKPVQCKKVVVKQYKIFVDATIGIFQLEGNPDFLQYLYQAGAGSKHSLGYGMLDVVAQKI
jgi:CRISPR-associated endoribonuclease Cas6